MSESSTPYLIAHKVRGEPAFDIAERYGCPECGEFIDHEYVNQTGCDECDQLGYQWIIPTSGHRAYPYWHVPIACLAMPPNFPLKRAMDDMLQLGNHRLPLDPWPDHYAANDYLKASKRKTKSSGSSLLDSLGLAPKSEPVKRRV